jgi:hypothetical protein
MADFQNAYTLRSWHLLRHPRMLRLPRRINAGLIQFPVRDWDPDLLEWYHARFADASPPFWHEQTSWALLAGRRPCTWFDPRCIRIPEAAASVDALAVGLHFAGPRRPLLQRYPDPSAADGRPPVQIRRVPAPRCWPWNLALTEAGRRAGRIRPSSSKHR